MGQEMVEVTKLHRIPETVPPRGCLVGQSGNLLPPRAVASGLATGLQALHPRGPPLHFQCCFILITSQLFANTTWTPFAFRMIIDRKSFSYKGQAILEKVLISAPHRYEALFHNEGCFIQVRGAGTRLLSAADNRLIENQEAVLMKCGTYFLDFLNKLTGHTVEVLAIHLYPDILKQLYRSELPALIERRAYLGKSTVNAHETIIARYIESLEFYFQNPALVNDDLLELKIKELVLLLVQTKNAASMLELVTDLYSSRSINLKHTIDLHKYSNLSIEELAGLCSLSLSAFKRAFKKVYNDNPTHYFTTEKLKKAKELLTISDLTIGEIAYETGFNDPLYFTRLFKKREGLTPTVFRATHALPAPAGSGAPPR